MVRHTLLLINLHLHIIVNARNQDVASNVHGADHVQSVWVVEWDFLADLHHHEDDDQIGATEEVSSWSFYTGIRQRAAWRGAGEVEGQSAQ